MPRELLMSRLEESTSVSDVVVAAVVAASRESLPSSSSTSSSSSPSFFVDHPVFPMRQTNILQ